MRGARLWSLAMSPDWVSWGKYSVHSVLTVVARFTLAPFFRRMSTVSLCPFWQATYSGLKPSCTEMMRWRWRNDNNMFTKWECGNTVEYVGDSVHSCQGHKQILIHVLHMLCILSIQFWPTWYPHMSCFSMVSLCNYRFCNNCHTSTTENADMCICIDSIHEHDHQICGQPHIVLTYSKQMELHWKDKWLASKTIIGLPYECTYIVKA